MANTSRTLRIIFNGSVRGVTEAAARVRNALRGMDDDTSRLIRGLDRTADRIFGVVKAFGALGAVSSVVPIIAGLTGAVVNLLPLLLTLPGIALGAAAAFGVFKLATAGVGDALKGDAEALAKLAPSAREFVQAVRGIKPEFDKLKQSVQGEFFKGFATEVKTLGQQYMPILNRELPLIAKGFNGIGIEALRAAQTPIFQGAVTRILQDTRGALDNMRGSAGNALTGLVRLGTIGSQYLPRIGKAIDDVAKRFADWVDKGLNDGSIQRMVDEAIQSFKDLATIVGNIGGIIDAVFRGISSGMRGGFIESFKESTQALKDFLNTASAQDGLQALGRIIQVAGDAFRDVLLAALKELLPAIKDAAPAIEAIARGIRDTLVGALQTVGPYIRDFAKWLSDNSQAIRDAVPYIIGFAVAIKGIAFAAGIITALATFAGAIRTLGTVLGALNTARLAALARILARFLLPVGLALALGEIAVAIDKLNVAAAGGDPEKLTGMARELHNLIGAFEQLASGDFAGIAADIGAEWQALQDQFKTGPNQSPIGQFKDLLLRDLGDILLDLTIWGQKIGAFFTNLPTNISGSLTSLGTTISTPFTTANDTVVATVSGMILSVVTFFQQLPGTVSGIVSGFVATVVGFFSGLRANVAGIVSGLITTISTGFRSAMTAASSAVSTGVQAVIGFFRNLGSQATAIINSLASSISNGFRDAMSRASSAVSSGIATVVGYFRGLPGQILGIINGLAGSLFASGSNMLNSFAAGIRSAGAAALNAARAAVAAVRAVFPFSPAKEGPFSGRGYTTYSGRALTADFASAIRAGTPGVIAAARSLTDAAHASLNVPAMLAGRAGNVSVSSGSSSPTVQVAAPTVRVYLGDQELTDLVRVEIDSNNREVARRLNAGASSRERVND